MVLIRTSTETWSAEYTVQGNRDAQIVRIKSRSSITVVIAKIMENLPLVGKTITYYISVPNYGIALPEQKKHMVQLRALLRIAAALNCKLVAVSVE